jgi:phosphodiesterase/alkaline phosphatase D-like protein
MFGSRPYLLSHGVVAWRIIAGLLAFVLLTALLCSGVAVGDVSADDDDDDDVTTLEISNVNASEVTATSAKIDWTTNEPATGQVQYGRFELFYGSLSRLETDLVVNHSVELSGLSAGTTYHYRVISVDAAGTEARSGDNTFTTAATDKQPPVISGVVATEITATSASIIWTTNEPATSEVEYGTLRTFGSNTPEDATLVTEHGVSLTGLIPNTRYYYRVISKDDSENEARSTRDSFRTLDATAPVIGGVTAIDVTATSATIIWTTDEAATSQVDYGLTAGYGLTTGPNMALVTSHRMVLTGLIPKAVYYYSVRSIDATNNLAQSAGYAFATADNDPPVISNVAATVTGMSVTFTWTTDEPATSEVEYGTSPSYGLITSHDMTLVTEHRVSLTGLSPQTTYHYMVKSRNASHLWGVSLGHTFATPDVTPPAISGVYSTDITANSATIAWATSEAATSLVVYGTSTSYGSTTSQDMTLLSSHSVGLTGLSPQTTYHFKVKSIDAAGLSAQSGDFTFTTTDVGAPVISGVTVINVTMTGATITWSTDDPADSQVEYGTKATYGSISTLDTNRVTSHSVTLADLSPGTAYHYKVKSRDDSGLWAWTGDYTFTTVADPNSVVPGTSGTTSGDGGGTGTAITGEASSFRLSTWAWAAIGIVVALVLGFMVVREV